MRCKLFFLSSLFFSTYIVYPLASCGSDGSTNDIGGFDKEFGFDVQTYNRLENEFINKYKNQLLDDNILDKNAAFEKYNDFLQNRIIIIRNQLFDPAKNYSFTIRTNALMDYAAKNYSIYLNRNANIGESAFDNLKQFSLENFIIYLNNIYGIDDIEDKQEKIDNFSTKFDQLLSQTKSKYADNAQILLHLRADIVNCWEDLDKEFSLLAANNHLRDFFDEYQLIVKDQSNKQIDNNELLWDNLLYNEHFITNDKIGLIDQDIDCSITDQWINKLFTISQKKKNTEANSVSQQNDATSDILTGYKEIQYFNSQEIIPGYTLTPVLKTMTQDIYANEYYMKIDWQLISNKYKDETDQKIKDSVTAHLAYNANETNSNDEQYLSSTDYQLLSTPKHQENNLKKAYFTSSKPGQNIVFSWDKDKTPLEHFFLSDLTYENTEPVIKDQYDLSMSQNNLSNACLKVNNEFLSNLLIAEGKVPHSANNVPTGTKITDNNSNSDSTWTIEEKFVHYCNISSATSHVTFYNSNTKNEITTSFIVGYANSQFAFDAIAEKTKISDIKLSNNFCNDAVGYYNDVNKFVDSKKIEKVGEEATVCSGYVITWLIAMGVLLIAIIALICLKRYINKKRGQEYPKINFLARSVHPLIVFGVLSAIAVVVLVAWICYIDIGINEHVRGIKKWNKALEEDDIVDKLHVLIKIKEDKKNFASAANFQKYFDTNRSKAYASYWYYLHFNNLKDKDANEKAEEVVNDYQTFCDKREEYEKTSDAEKLKWIFYVIFVIVLLLTFSFFVILICAVCVTYQDYKSHAAAINGVNDSKNAVNNSNNNAQENNRTIKRKNDSLLQVKQAAFNNFLDRLKEKYKYANINWNNEESILNNIELEDVQTYLSLSGDIWKMQPDANVSPFFEYQNELKRQKSLSLEY